MEKNVKIVLGARQIVLIIFIIIAAIIFLPHLFVERKVVIEEQFRQPVKEVFRSIVDPRKMRVWLTKLERFEAIDGTLEKPGPNYLVTYKIRKKKIVIREKLLKLDWDKQIYMAFYPRKMVVRVNMTFAENEAGTLMHFEMTFEPVGLVNRMLLPYVKHRFNKEIRLNLKNLKNYLR